MRTWLTAFLTLGCMAQIPYDQLDPQRQEEARTIVRKADFVFETHTPPKKVRLATMEKLFDHPRLSAAMWRHCRFVPEFFTFAQRDGAWSLDDGKGLRGTMELVYRKPGLRVYFVEGIAERGRLKTPFAVRARMVTVYHYWDGPKGFESSLQTWTALDSALLGFVAKPFRGYIRLRQEEFIAYINGNIATFGEFAELDPQEFYQPLKQEGDASAVREFEVLFLRK
jgi:hypothetical protein